MKITLKEHAKQLTRYGFVTEYSGTPLEVYTYSCGNIEIVAHGKTFTVYLKDTVKTERDLIRLLKIFNTLKESNMIEIQDVKYENIFKESL